MEIPRISSQASICPPTIQVTPFKPNRTGTFSQRLLNQHNNYEPTFAILPTTPNYQPSRKREEAEALQNLRRKFRAVKILEANRPEPPVPPFSNNNLSPTDVDNRPNLLQKILHNRPMSMVLDISDLRTAWQDSDFISECLCWHNVYRQRHNSPTLTMSAQLCHLAQTWANHLAHTNRFYYRNDKDIGQNLFCKLSNGVDSTDISGQEVANYWYRAVKQYDYGKEPDVLHTNVNSGHFTQLVWAGSRRFGIGKARSRTGKVVVVAHYHPPGNISGHYLQNVFPPCMEFPNITGSRLLRSRFKMTSDSTGSRSTTSDTSEVS
ncbi:probable pathogenesis-related protein CaO19.6200 [Coccinella septempunctata]|uniref:probable pathogenesis-related protein CaO19.6200 n=1 Tax=Coccinella septempunctata TaxID=41139 RepID=UPI001D080F2E|nr:probable pathogenesis-related protein CaO19.6200 [Coccinella septempunctata]